MTRSNDELKAMAEHVEYEVAEFRTAVAALQRLKKSDAQWNGTIESALLHFRILRAFFFGEKGGSDDVLAEHFVVGWNPTPESVFGATKTDIDKRLAHLTTRRLTPFSWPIAEMNSAIEKMVADFRNRLSSSQREWFPRLLEPPAVFTVSSTNDYSTDSRSAHRVLIDADFRLYDIEFVDGRPVRKRDA